MNESGGKNEAVVCFFPHLSLLCILAAEGREGWQYDGIAGFLSQQLCQHLAIIHGPTSTKIECLAGMASWCFSVIFTLENIITVTTVIILLLLILLHTIVIIIVIA